MNRMISGLNRGRGGYKGSQVPSVPHRDAAGSVHFDVKLVMVKSIHDCAGSIPFLGGVACLVLNKTLIADMKGAQRVCMFVECFRCFDESCTECGFLRLPRLAPSGPYCWI